jgi:hypothetical protein
MKSPSQTENVWREYISLTIGASTMLSVPSAPREPHPNADASQKHSRQLLAIVDWNEAGLLITDFDNADRDGSHPATAASSFAASAGIADTACTGSSTVAIHDLCYRYDRLPLRRNWFTIDGLHTGLTENAIPK